MKKLVILVVVALSCFQLSAQTKSYYVYGVDFSYAKVYAAEESIEQFTKVFEGINMLFINEPEKYDFSRMVGKRVQVMVEPALKAMSTSDFTNLISLDSKYEDPKYSDIIKNYDISQTEGVGLILIAKVLSKPTNLASYELITFDITSREILSKREVIGKAGGFGLRNFWAGSIYKIIKSTKLY